jgi:hypothetical protein
MLYDYLQLAFGYAIYNYLNVLTPLGLYFLQLFSINYYIITGEKDEIRKVMKVLERDSRSSSCKYLNGRTIMCGYFMGFSGVGYIDNISRYDEDCKIYMLTRADIYKQIIEDRVITFVPVETVDSGEECENVENGKIKVFIRSGTFKNFYYSSIMLDMSDIEPIGDQKHVVQSCIGIFKKKGRATLFIHGVSGAGKSSIGYLVAKALNGFYCHSFNPSDPGDQFSSLLTGVENRDSYDKPLVIVLEEVDDILKGIHNKTILPNKEIPISVHNKSTWTTFLDEMAFWKNVVLIMTSNTSKGEIDAMDIAYLGKNRVHACFEMNTPLTFDS